MLRVFKSMLLAVVPVLMASSPAFAKLALSKYPKVYKGEEGLVVTVIPLQDKEKKQALIEVSGVDTEIDGKVFLYDLENQGKEEAYTLKWDGEDHTRLRVEDGYWLKWINVWLPEHAMKSYQVWYDEKLSKKAKPADYATRYEKDKALQAELAKFNRPKNVAYNEKNFAKTVAEVKTDCGLAVDAKIDWPTIKDETIMEYSVYSFCGYPLEALASYCRENAANKKSVSGKLAGFKCQAGAKLNAKMEGKAFVWTNDFTTGNQQDFATAFVKNTF